MKIPNVSYRFLPIDDSMPGQYVDYPDVQTLIAYDNLSGIRMGVVVFTVYRDTVRIHDLFIDEDYRLHGLARTLVKHLQTQYNTCTIKAHLEKQGELVMATFLRMGFQITGKYLGRLAEALLDSNGRPLRSGVYPPPKVEGWTLTYVGQHKPVVQNHSHLQSFLSDTVESEIYHTTFV